MTELPNLLLPQLSVRQLLLQLFQLQRTLSLHLLPQPSVRQLLVQLFQLQRTLSLPLLPLLLQPLIFPIARASSWRPSFPTCSLSHPHPPLPSCYILCPPCFPSILGMLFPTSVHCPPPRTSASVRLPPGLSPICSPSSDRHARPIAPRRQLAFPLLCALPTTWQPVPAVKPVPPISPLHATTSVQGASS